MRNVMESQNENDKHNDHLRTHAFMHEILCLVRNRSILEICLCHSLTKVVKSHVLVHKDIPFSHWRTIDIDNDGFPEGQNLAQNRDSRVDNYATAKQFLVATFINSYRFYLFEGWFNWCIYPLDLFTHETLDFIEINDPTIIVNSWHHTWRRVYEDNFTLFSCTQDDIDAYVKEQTHGKRLPNVFKQLMSRAMGECFKQFSLLKSIASPYYYELPHQDKEEYETFTEDPNWCFNRSSTRYMIFTFESSLNLAIKNAA
ncbi:uncharacterized protein TNCV_4019331 [Trichonephila clavipes]|nr:uncharacterized protein TNCV_4019331 [Trichonephila clavipes]